LGISRVLVRDRDTHIANITKIAKISKIDDNSPGSS
jgi:hypothetical protein